MSNELYPGLIDFIKSKLVRGARPSEFFDKAVEKYGYANEKKQFYRYCNSIKNRYLKGMPNIRKRDLDKTGEKFLKVLKKKKVIDGNEMCDELGCHPEKIFELIKYFRTMGHEIIVDESKIILSSEMASPGENVKKPLESKEIIFAIASDLHFGSKHCQITHLLEFLEICRKKGVKYVFIPGDLVAGYGVFPGQQFEVYAMSAEEQEDSVVLNMPEGFEYYALGGNHDYSYIKRVGHNPLLTIEQLRDDFHYIGYDEADVPILPGVDVKLWHPSGGVPYAISYRLQKGIEQVAYQELAKLSLNVKEKPSIRFMLCGHLHVQMQGMFGSIFGAQCGTFEGQTNYLKRKGLHPLIGGYIIKADISREGILRSFSAKYYMFPNEIEDDWKNYKHSLDRTKIVTPIFDDF